MQLGFPHPDHLLALLTVEQFSEWMAYYTLEPWGERPDFLRMGILAATIANVNRSRKSKAFRPEDFIPREPELSRPKEQTPEEQKEAILQMAGWFEKRGRLKRKQRT